MRNTLHAIHARRLGPALCLSIVLAGFAFAHIDDIDALYYRDLGRGAIVNHRLFDLRWSQLPQVQFIDHLPPGIWTAGLADLTIGERGGRLAYGAISFATFALLATFMQTLGAPALSGWMFVLVASTGAFVHPLTQQRLDPPFMLLWMLALFIAARGTRTLLPLAGLMTGLAALYRPPQALALLLLVPLSMIAGRAQRNERWCSVRDCVYLLLFIVASALPLGLFHLADLRFGDGQSINNFVHVQVLSSLTGDRPDGAGSHWAPLAKLFSHFWPGMAGVLFAVWQHRRKRAPIAVTFAWVWAASVILALSLGKRHVWLHSWPAYPALFIIAAWGYSELFAEALNQPRLARVARPILHWASRAGATAALLVASAVFALGMVLFADRDCDVVQLQDRLAALPAICPQAIVASNDGGPDWRLAHTLLDHLHTPLVFVRADSLSLPAPQSCLQLIAMDRSLALSAQLGPALLMGRRHAFWLR